VCVAQSKEKETKRKAHSIYSYNIDPNRSIHFSFSFLYSASRNTLKGKTTQTKFQLVPAYIFDQKERTREIKFNQLTAYGGEIIDAITSIFSPTVYP
jgi:hypothetical protein